MSKSASGQAPRSRSTRRARDAQGLGQERGYAVQDQVGHLLRRAHQRHCGIFAENFEAQLTPTQFAALAMIAERGKVSQNHLGRLVAMDPATTQGVAKRLADRELITSEPDPADGRRYVWRLTPAGGRLLDKLIPVAERITAETLAPLSMAERRTFIKLLRKLA